jgi:acyl-CoA dehydrogenase
MPAEVGGAGLDTLTWVLYEKELGRANYALHWTCVGRPSNILEACTGEQRERYLMPCVRGERADCLAMTEPGAGSDLRGMKTTAVQSNGDWVIDGVKHFISHADVADFVILFAATGEEDTPRGKKKLITAFLVDKGTPGFTVRDGYRNVSHRGYDNAILEFDGCRLPAAGAGRGAQGLRGRQHLARRHPPAGRRHLPRPRRTRAFPRRRLGRRAPAVRPADRQVPGRLLQARRHGHGAQGGRAADLEAGWKYDQGSVTDQDMAMAKLKATEMLAMVADEAIQIHGGMGLMEDLPLERIWRDARVERIWEGTSEIQRHIISRALLRPLGG